MDSTTGKNWIIGTYVGSTGANLGGIPFDVRVSRKATNTKEAGTGQRRLASIDTSGVHYVIDFKLKLTSLNFINTNCMPTAEGDLPANNYFISDGIDKRGFKNGYVNTCRVEIKQTGAIVASIQVIALDTEAQDLTIPNPTGAPLTKSALTSLTIAGVPITKWTDVWFEVNNNVQVVSTGNGVAATEVYAKHVEYSGSATYVKTAALAYGFSTTVTGDFVVALGSTYTFISARASTNDYYVQELDLTYEAVSWDCDKLVIT